MFNSQTSNLLYISFAIAFFAVVLALFYRKKLHSTMVLSNRLSKADQAIHDVTVELKKLNHTKEKLELVIKEIEEVYNASLQKKKDVMNELSDLYEKFSRTSTELVKAQKQKKHLIELEAEEYNIREELIKNRNNLNELENQENNCRNKIMQMKEEIRHLQSTIALYTQVREYTDVGFFEEPEYLYNTSDRFKEQIMLVREEQKKLISENKAIAVPNEIFISDSKEKQHKILKGQAKLMLQSFNIECDSLIMKINVSNYAKTLERIDKIAENIEKTAANLLCGFTLEYVELKREECKMQYQYKLKKQEEDDERIIQKQRIKEENMAIKEYEQAMAKAQKEEELYRKLLDKARIKLEKVTDKEKLDLQIKIETLEQQLQDAINAKERAKSMAEQTRRGFVYIISNIGSFGENIYKIGLTRRLEPLERVQELSGASVPFPYDVHAMIYSDDAPALEARLHREFGHNRVNIINRHKEFFAVSLDDIKEKVLAIYGEDVEFITTPAAEQYYESRKMTGNRDETK